MKAKLEKKRLVITLPLLVEPRSSRSGKSVMIASSRGPRKASLTVEGKPVYVGVNAFIRTAVLKSKCLKSARKRESRMADFGTARVSEEEPFRLVRKLRRQ